MSQKPARLLLLTIVITACTSCATPNRGNPENPLIGQWKGNFGAREVTIAIHPRGTCDALEPGVTMHGTWIQKGSNVTLTLDKETLYGGLISKREMLLTRGDSGQTITLLKTGEKFAMPSQ
jgi:hypothetical protein